jgi:surface polysaccharide O-acyltransferase-like enzyme
MENNDIKSPLISTKNKSERNSSIELLRLLAMLLIVFNHWFVHGIGVDYSLFSLRETLCQMLGFLGCIGVDVYMLISGYYLINGHFHWSKFWSIIFQTIVISILWLLTDFLCVYFNYISWPDITNLNLAVFIIHSCLPFISNYWFIAGYLVIYLISPFLNKMIKALSKKDFGIFVLISTIVVTVISLITTNVFYSPLLILLNCYFIGSFLGLYFQDVNIKTVYVWMSLFISITLEVSSVIVMAYLGSKYSLFLKKIITLLAKTLF